MKQRLTKHSLYVKNSVKYSQELISKRESTERDTEWEKYQNLNSSLLMFRTYALNLETIISELSVVEHQQTEVLKNSVPHTYEHSSTKPQELLVNTL